MSTPLPPPDEPDIYEALINALIAASTAFRKASPHFEAALPHMRRALELDREVQVMLEESAAVSERATELLLEAVALVQVDPLGNITEALALSAQSTASTALASVEMTRGAGNLASRVRIAAGWTGTGHNAVAGGATASNQRRCA